MDKRSRAASGSLTVLKKNTRETKAADRIVRRAFRDLKAEYYDISFAISLLEPAPVKERILPATDGEHYFYNPAWILDQAAIHLFKQSIQMSILHITLHGLLGHFQDYAKYRSRQLIFDVMDIQVHQVLNNIARKYDPILCGISFGDESRDYGMYYASVKDQKRRRMLRSAAKAVQMDDHSFWPQPAREASPDTKDQSVDGQGAQAPTDGKPGASGGGQKALVMKPDPSGRRQKGIAEKWEEAGRLLLGDPKDAGSPAQKLEMILIKDQKSMEHGKDAGAAAMEAASRAKKTASYLDRLKEFVQLKETNREEDAIDPMLYEYGLSLYEDMPLVEPVDEGEKLSLHSLVLALDTSGSCVGIADQFLAETNQIFSDIRDIAVIDHLHLLQCDAAIQAEECFDGIEELKDIRTKQMYGFGGTDFRPVFDRAEEYIKKGEEISLLIYLSDAYGSFPNKKPDYPVWFVMSQADYDQHCRFGKSDLPDWVELIVLN